MMFKIFEVREHNKNRSCDKSCGYKFILRNEQGIASLTAICMLFLTSMIIASVTGIAARQADILRCYRVENKLQCAAESVFNNMIVNLERDSSTFYYSLDYDDNNAHRKKDYTITLDGETIKVRVHMIRSELRKMVIVTTLAEIEKYHYNLYPAFKRVSGYLDMDIDGETGSEKYIFKGYLY